MVKQGSGDKMLRSSCVAECERGLCMHGVRDGNRPYRTAGTLSCVLYALFRDHLQGLIVTPLACLGNLGYLDPLLMVEGVQHVESHQGECGCTSASTVASLTERGVPVNALFMYRTMEVLDDWRQLVHGRLARTL